MATKPSIVMEVPKRWLADTLEKDHSMRAAAGELQLCELWNTKWTLIKEAHVLKEQRDAALAELESLRLAAASST